MERSNDERLLDLRALVRRRFERDLRSLADISAERAELSLRDMLDEVHHIYVHYLQQNALLDNASSSIHRDDSQLRATLDKLRSVDS
jgi:hypothetical protein